jgi:uncharacterized membrane protein YidH (DUF202 family)
MVEKSPTPHAVRPVRIVQKPVPPIPDVDTSNADQASVAFSHYRTTLSHSRTGMSEHRTDLSEYRTDLSMERTEMSMRRTGMSFQRTRLSGDRTLMSSIRTSLSLIGFGFTIQQAFERLREAGTIHSAGAPQRFGLLLILLGVAILVGGIVQFVQFENELRQTRHTMMGEALVHGESRFPVSITLLVAIALLLIGCFAALNIVFGLALFG